MSELGILEQVQRIGAIGFDSNGRKFLISGGLDTYDIKFFTTKGQSTNIPGQRYYDINNFMNSIKREGRFIKMRKLYNNPTVLFRQRAIINSDGSITVFLNKRNYGK